jgi:hypothetical protein
MPGDSDQQSAISTDDFICRLIADDRPWSGLVHEERET